MTKSFDFIVIGGGPGGYVAAIRAAQCGHSVALVEKESSLGGTCLNRGCIPSKALLDSSEHFHCAKEKFECHGITIPEPKLNLSQMMKRKTDVVKTTTQGIDYLMKKNKITRFEGLGRFKDPHTVEVVSNKSEILIGKHIIIATGSDVMPLPCVPIDGKQIISSTEALSLTTLPKHLIVIGGGVIGVEIGSVYARLGTQVTVIEFMDRIIPGMDRDLSKALRQSLKKLGMTFHLGTQVTGYKKSKSAVTLTAKKGAEDIHVSGDRVLVAIGRKPFTEGLNLGAIGVSLDEKGRIPINPQFQTSCSSVYAIGDVVAGPMLAHKASEEGVACVEGIVGQHAHLNYETIPGVVYTWPEVAAVGKTEDDLKASGIAYKKGQFPFKASGRARASEESDGFIKVLSDSDSDEILGVHMIGPRAADLISEAVLGMEFRASAEDIGMIMHPHPTYSEVFKEAALIATDNRGIHI